MLITTKTIDRLVEQTSDADTQIVVTLSPIGRRAISIWQERMKHRRAMPLESACELVCTRPGLAPDFTHYFTAAFPTSKVSVIIPSRSAPMKLYEGFSQATGVLLSPSSGNVIMNSGPRSR